MMQKPSLFSEKSKLQRTCQNKLQLREGKVNNLGWIFSKLTCAQKLDLVRPVVLHIMCDPHLHEHLGSLRSATAKVVLKDWPSLVPAILQWADTSTPRGASEHIGKKYAIDCCNALSYVSFYYRVCVGSV